jgi:hypothetical protein
MAGKSKKRKKQINYMPVLVVFLILAVLTGTIVVIGTFSGKNKKNSVSAYGYTDSAKNTLLEDDTHQIDIENDLQLRINLSNCTLLVGTVLNVTADASTEIGNSITWISSNEDVIRVDSTGRLIVVGRGIATLTASVGSVNASVIIEGVESVEQAVLGFPLSETQDSMENQTAAGTALENTGEQTTVFAASAQTQAQTGAAQEPLQTDAAQQTQSAQTATQAAAQTPVQTTANPTTAALSDVKSTDLTDSLIEYGFTRHTDGTYVYEKDGVCCGEVILDSDKTHIYVMQNREDFNLAAVSLLAKLLPTSYESTWKVAAGASSDMTMTVDGRMVRIVVPQTEGHKQIVIYN